MTDYCYYYTAVRCAVISAQLLSYYYYYYYYFYYFYYDYDYLYNARLHCRKCAQISSINS